MSKVYFVGIDSLPMWVVEELKKSNVIGFSKFVEEGKIVESESVIPPVTGIAWPSIYTGLPPGRHGAKNFFVLRENYALDIIFYDPERAKPFWDALAEKGYKSLIIAPPAVVKPSKNANVHMITGFPLPPKANSKELELMMKKYGYKGESIERGVEGGKFSIEKAAKIMLDSVKAKIGISREMLARQNYDFFHVCFTEFDALGHYTMGLTNWKDYMLPLYKEVGSFLDFLMRKAKEEGSLVTIASDHGMQRIYKKFLINSWLVKKNYALIKANIATNKAGSQRAGGEKLYVFRDLILTTKLRHIYKALPLHIRSFLMRLVEVLLVDRRAGEYVKIYTSDFDMKHTKVFAFMAVDPVCGLFINDKRFVSGCVGEKEKEALKIKLMRDLANARDERGKIFAHIWDAEKYYGKGFYSGPITPDIFVGARDGLTIDPLHYSKEKLFMEPDAARKADHMLYGVFGFYPKISLHLNRNFKITHIAPLILSLYK
ncbi:MAG: alkaline phosphatase family protein [Candidatus Micrarchaeia archaeon]